MSEEALIGEQGESVDTEEEHPPLKEELKEESFEQGKIPFIFIPEDLSILLPLKQILKQSHQDIMQTMVKIYNIMNLQDSNEKINKAAEVITPLLKGRSDAIELLHVSPDRTFLIFLLLLFIFNF